MYPEDIEALFPLVPVGTPVYLVNEPLKLAWVNGALILEAHPPVNAEGQTVEPDVQQFEGMLEQALGDTVVAIHWDLARAELRKARGMPVVVGLAADRPDAPVAVPAAQQAPAEAPVGPVAPPSAQAR
jgi:L,D-transpeptidase ErfK/SrfK